MPFPTSPHQRPFGRRQALRLLGGAGMATGAALLGSGCTITRGTPPIASTGLDKKPAPGRKTSITLYSCWGGPTGQGLVKLCQEFEKVQPDIGIRVIFAPTIPGGTSQPKLFTAIAGRTPPDIGQIIPSQAAQWSELGIMTDLTDWFKRDGLKSKDFYPPVWESMIYQDRVWLLQWDADPNFPFFWNKGLFEDSGLDPERPPKTMDEVDEFSAKITEKHGSNIAKIGMIPWDSYGFANSIFTWGWSFGGSFYDTRKERVTVDDDNLIKALEWMTNYAKRLGGADKVTVAPPGLQTHVFGTGNVGMSPLVAPNYALIKETVKDLRIGTTLLPYQPPGASRPGQGAWMGGWGMFIPSEAKHKEEAWEFIKWASATPEGTSKMYEHVGFPSGWRRSPSQKVLAEDPIMSPFYDVLTTTTNIRPPTPVSDFMFQQFEDKISRAIFGQTTPAEALRDVQENTAKELERFRQEVK